ncbi:MAG: DUF1667 domain-containing protein [Bacillota bacterium]|nr:DUF1667 domain-containing protein [Bacillota bacterium]
MIKDMVNEKSIINAHEIIRDEFKKCNYEQQDSGKKEILTTVVRVKGGKVRVVPVKSNKPMDKSLFLECSKALGRIYVGLPINVGDIICHNILNTGIDIICTKRVDKK